MLFNIMQSDIFAFSNVKSDIYTFIPISDFVS